VKSVLILAANGYLILLHAVLIKKGMTTYEYINLRFRRTPEVIPRFQKDENSLSYVKDRDSSIMYGNKEIL
jgi:hypothetical protein